MRRLSNPPLRSDLRADFPAVLDVLKPEEMLLVIEQELLKQGTCLAHVQHITLAYPHKHPEKFPNHANSATEAVNLAVSSLRKIMPEINWLVADGICETKHLYRSENQSVTHTLMSSQVYDFHAPSQTVTLPFLNTARKRKDFFLIVDYGFAQGTTLASLKSFIEHNGGIVLATAALISIDTADRPFVSSQKNIEDMAKAFAASARKKKLSWTAEECLKSFTAALTIHGKTLGGLTRGECKKIISAVGGKKKECSFPALLKTMSIGKG